MLAMAIALLIGGRLLRYVEWVALGGTGAAAMGLALAVVARRPRVTVAVSVVPRRVARGEPAALVLALANLSRWSAPPFELRLPCGRDAPDIVRTISRLAGTGDRSVEVALRTSTRGVVTLGPAEVIRSDPFGLVIRRQAVAAPVTLFVRPDAQPLAALASAPSREPDGQTGHGTAGGLEIHTLRPYTAGEDLRLVHWLSSARVGELMVRTHVDPTEPAATVVLDVRPAAYPPGRVGETAFEQAVDVAAAAVMTCARESLGVRLVTTAGLRASGRRRRQDAGVLLDELAGVSLDDAATLDVVGTLRRGGLGTLVLVTGGFDRQGPAALAPVAHAYGRVVLVRVGPRSVATARALDRRDSSDRPRLRSTSPAPDQAAGVTGWGRSAPAGARPIGTWPVEDVGLRTAGRLTLIDIPDAAALAHRWPAPTGSGRDAAWDGRR
ncbi:hypothetical protein FRACA_2730003 [Frankia canadensis]|uniref:DUF58 domain-containing protein n=1 Tax=Frankia canadensis TaxID=1836972 RepID=A0A2I2KST5_9ACTN|nr:hypothetical protein FRACA_2730003 [Frankia canadensis]SOU56028.1 hypothetical protein FRACA_2730003 [Frankia canadensis]